ncbi:MAG TPA: ATP-binding protein [Opitutaceae bacterium]|nr:ATP-binding protein [Opitutaceae bacterium]
MNPLPPIDEGFIAQLRARLNQSEDPWTERKPVVKPSDEGRDIRRTLVGFANSVREGEFAVLFIGAANDGRHPGVHDADEMQRKVDSIARQRCFPPIDYTPVVFKVSAGTDEATIVAVVVGASRNWPHFAGHAYVRRGSKTVESSAAMLDELIAGRTDPGRTLQTFKGRVLVRERSSRGLFLQYPGSIHHLDQHAVQVKEEVTGDIWAVPVKQVEILSSQPLREEIGIPTHATESALIERMLNHWRWGQKSPMAELPRDTEQHYLVRQLLPIAPEVASILGVMGWPNNSGQSPERRLFELFSARSRVFH